MKRHCWHLVDDLRHLITVVRRIVAHPQFSLATFLQDQRLEKRHAAVRSLDIMKTYSTRWRMIMDLSKSPTTK